MAAPTSMPPRVSVGHSVLVTTPSKIGGQNEHAAIVTAIEGDDVVTVLLMPAAADPYPVTSVPAARGARPGALSWRWPPPRR